MDGGVPKADARNVERSMENGMNHLAIAEAIGMTRDGGTERNLAALKRALGDRPEDIPHRRNALAAIATQSMEFREHNIEYGHKYASTAVVADGTPAPDPVDEVRMYVASTRPGSPLPHA